MLEVLAADTLEKLKHVSTATITSQLIKQAGLRNRSPRGVRPLNPTCCHFVAEAATLRYAPMREDLDGRASTAQHDNPTRLAVETTPPGHVLMIDQAGSQGAGALGDILVARMIRRGVAAVVGDGAMRDSGPLKAMSMPIFSASLIPPPSNAAILAVGFQEPIGCGGVLVYPGDVVVGDEDGVVVIPRHLADQVATAGLDQEQIEVFIKQRIEQGEPVEGFYPATERTKAEYAAWKAAQGRA
jgi:regulator of RNase E activity RraA